LPEFRDAAVLEHVGVDDVRGKEVAGNLPLSLAAAAYAVWAVEFTGAPPRGAEYTLADMDAAGAQVRLYKVQAQGPARSTRRPADTPSNEIDGVIRELGYTQGLSLSDLCRAAGADWDVSYRDVHEYKRRAPMGYNTLVYYLIDQGYYRPPGLADIRATPAKLSPAEVEHLEQEELTQEGRPKSAHHVSSTQEKNP